jgi:hypothetical protein
MGKPYPLRLSAKRSNGKGVPPVDRCPSTVDEDLWIDYSPG